MKEAFGVRIGLCFRCTAQSAVSFRIPIKDRFSHRIPLFLCISGYVVTRSYSTLRLLEATVPYFEGLDPKKGCNCSGHELSEGRVAPCRTGTPTVRIFSEL